MNASAQTNWPPKRIASVALLAAPFAFLGYCWLDCRSGSARREAESAVDDPPAPRDESVAPKDETGLLACRGCSGSPDSVRWMFNGQYSNAQCTTPIAQATFGACDVVSIPGFHDQVQMQFNEPLGTAKMNDLRHVEFWLQIQPSDGMVFQRKSGQCVSAGHLGLRQTPMGCEGRACRSGGQLVCGKACAPMKQGQCPDFEGHVTMATFAAP